MHQNVDWAGAEVRTLKISLLEMRKTDRCKLNKIFVFNWFLA